MIRQTLTSTCLPGPSPAGGARRRAIPVRPPANACSRAFAGADIGPAVRPPQARPAGRPPGNAAADRPISAPRRREISARAAARFSQPATPSRSPRLIRGASIRSRRCAPGASPAAPSPAPGLANRLPLAKQAAARPMPRIPDEPNLPPHGPGPDVRPPSDAHLDLETDTRGPAPPDSPASSNRRPGVRKRRRCLTALRRVSKAASRRQGQMQAWILRRLAQLQRRSAWPASARLPRCQSPASQQPLGLPGKFGLLAQDGIVAFVDTAP
jgi:hypothetical protein